MLVESSLLFALLIYSWRMVRMFLFHCLRIINASHEMMILHRVNYGYVKVTVNIKKEKKKNNSYMKWTTGCRSFFIKLNFNWNWDFFPIALCTRSRYYAYCNSHQIRKQISMTHWKWDWYWPRQGDHLKNKLILNWNVQYKIIMRQVYLLWS